MFKKILIAVGLNTLILGNVYAYTIDSTFRPTNTPFALEENTKEYGVEDSTVIILQIIAGALLYFATPLAIILIGFNAFNMVIFGAESEKLEQAKKGLTWAAIGLLVIILSYSITRAIIQLVIDTAEPPGEETSSPAAAATGD